MNRPDTPSMRRTAARCRWAPAAAAWWFSAAAAAQTSFDFAPPVTLPTGFVSFPTSAAAGDLDGDGAVDLVLTTRSVDGVLVIFWGAGPGGAFSPPVTVDAGGQTNWVEIGHLDGDEFLDIAYTLRQGVGRVAVILGDGTRQLPAAVQYRVGRAPEQVRIADVDGDLDADLVVLNGDTYDVSILRNDGAGVFEEIDRIDANPVSSGSSSPTWSVVADLDGDLDLDIAVVSINAHDVIHVLRNRGDGTFDPAVQNFVPGAEGDDAISTLAVADLDGDGDADLLTKAGDITFIDRMIVMGNDGTGSFSPSAVVQLSAGLGGSPWDMATADFDGDQVPDIAWVTHAFSTQSAAFLRNLGTSPPSFETPEQAFGLGAFPRQALPYDVDGDGDIDLVVPNVGNHTVSWFENLQIGAAAAGPRSPSGGVAGRAGGTVAALRSLAGWHGQPVGLLGACGDPESGPCDEVHEGAGCDDETCCTAVCEQIPICCVVGWGQDCVDVAADVCEEPPPCPAEGSCFEAHDTFGCDDPACCELVCLFDGFCCFGAWDPQCAAEALQVCGQPSCSLAPCPITATVEDEGFECNVRVNDGCNMEVPAFTPITCGEVICGTVWTSNGSRDTDWYEVTLDEVTDLSWSVNAEFPTELFIVAGSCDTTYTTIAAASGDGCAGSTAVHQVLDPGTYYLYVAPGTETAPVNGGVGCIFDGEEQFGGAFGRRYFAQVFCNPGCAEDLNGDGGVGSYELLTLLGLWGTDPGGPPDLDGDGVVDTVDFVMLLAAWGECG